MPSCLGHRLTTQVKVAAEFTSRSSLAYQTEYLAQNGCLFPFLAVNRLGKAKRGQSNQVLFSLISWFYHNRPKKPLALFAPTRTGAVLRVGGSK